MSYYTWKDKITATFLLKFQITFYYRLLSNNLSNFVRSIYTAKNFKREYIYLQFVTSESRIVIIIIYKDFLLLSSTYIVYFYMLSGYSTSTTKTYITTYFSCAFDCNYPVYIVQNIFSFSATFYMLHVISLLPIVPKFFLFGALQVKHHGLVLKKSRDFKRPANVCYITIECGLIKK